MKLLFLFVLIGTATAQEVGPQPVGPSASWCKQTLIDQYNPLDVERYEKRPRTGGAVDNPIKCIEILDKKNSYCMVKFSCGETS